MIYLPSAMNISITHLYKIIKSAEPSMSTELEHWERYCQTERGGEVRERSNDLRSPNEVPHILVPRRMISLADTANKTYTEPPSD